MGYKEITLKMPTDFTDEALRSEISKTIKAEIFSFRILKQSLDARQKRSIHWLLTIGVTSDMFQEDEKSQETPLVVPYKKRSKRIVIVGSGPAGFFAAFILQKGGFKTIIIERGLEVSERAAAINLFEKTGTFNRSANYAFGEGGAGTFSDGKLTARTKRIARERQFILEEYIRAGAPKEIAYLAHPHIGSDKLKKVVKNLREIYKNLGGRILFETTVTDIKKNASVATEVITNTDSFEADEIIFAPGHSAYETYRMLMKNDVYFKTKNFALGCRVEHSQEIINRARWGKAVVPGLKAAEYRLTSKGVNDVPVYTFCMCPGGMVVPAAAYAETNIVNGMSMYNRSGLYANAACVAGVNVEALRGQATSPLDALSWLEELEQSFFKCTNGYSIPACSIDDFVKQNAPKDICKSSYPLGLQPAPLWELLPLKIQAALRVGLGDFSRTIKGFDKGIIMGLESKTSSPIQVARESHGLCCGFENLYLVGEGSGYAGGIISSGVDGIRAALAIIEKDS